MSSPITTRQIERIAESIREWPQDTKLTWDAICAAAELELGYIPTRQALASKTVLVNSYHTRKAEIKNRHKALTSTPTPKSMAAAIDTIIKLQEEKEQLKAELNNMALVVQRLIHNASLHGLSRAQLMAPLPKLDRRK